jgi:type VI secretion system secreted protein Hcp
MPSDYYVKIDGVKGESQAVDMQDYIELDSFSFGASNPADVGGKGLAAGKASLSDFSFTCPLDAASAFILKNLYMGKHIATCTFVGRKTGGDGKPYKYLEVKFTNCFVTSHSTGGGAQGVPSQSVSVAYEQIEYEYSTQDTSTGGVTSSGVATYHIAKVQAT